MCPLVAARSWDEARPVPEGHCSIVAIMWTKIGDPESSASSLCVLDPLRFFLVESMYTWDHSQLRGVCAALWTVVQTPKCWFLRAHNATNPPQGRVTREHRVKTLPLCSALYRFRCGKMPPEPSRLVILVMKKEADRALRRGACVRKISVPIALIVLCRGWR